MRLLVSDANIFIDMEEGGLLASLAITTGQSHCR